MGQVVLQVDELKVNFHTRQGMVEILNGTSFMVEEGELLGLVGESGSGKTVLAKTLLGYIRAPGRIAGGRVVYRDVDLLRTGEDTLNRAYRGQEIGLIAANARAHLNPLRRVGDLIADSWLAHHRGERKEANRQAVEMLRAVGINDPERRSRSFPHELSGGMAQRVMIALVLVNSPMLLVADDCTNGLDVTVAAQVMDLFIDLFRRQNSSGILITHDLGLVARYCQRVAILYQGRIVETAPVDVFFRRQEHPYSRQLIESLPEHKARDRITGHGEPSR